MITNKINESFYSVEIDDINVKQNLANKLSVEIKNAKYDPGVQGGWKSDREFFFRVDPENNNKLIIPIGLVPFLHDFNISPIYQEQDYTKEEILQYIDDLGLPFKLFDHQVEAILDSILNKKQMVISCTGSGKSAIVSIVSSFLVSKGLKGLILVPGIGLVSQIHSDILDYNLQELYDNTHLIGGEYNQKNFDKPLTISTWQSVRLFKEELPKIDFIIVDEAHGIKGKETMDILYKCENAEYKIGLTGTLPEDPYDRMSILSCIGVPKTYIKTQGLIELGLATPVNINVLNLKYNKQWSAAFRAEKIYSKQLKFIKEYQNRNDFISSLSCLVSGKTGNTLTLFSHTEHGKEIFKKIVKKRTSIDIENKYITGKKAYDFQNKHGIFFINGEVKAKVREEIRKILEEHEDAIIVANYSVMSTGVNIKKISNIIFASPMKSFVTITQSIGRGIRTHKTKSVMNLYDLTDQFTPFRKQFEYRKRLSYETEGFPMYYKEVLI